MGVGSCRLIHADSLSGDVARLLAVLPKDARAIGSLSAAAMPVQAAAAPHIADGWPVSPAPWAPRWRRRREPQAGV